MLEANVPAKVVQDILGHADVTLTLNTYSHVMGLTAHEQMAKINGLFQAAEPKKPEDAPSITNPKQSIKQQLAEAKHQQKAQAKPPIKKTKGKGDLDL